MRKNPFRNVRYYTIDSDKLDAITRIINQETDPEAVSSFVQTMICGDWHEGAEHQKWIDSANPQEIADWIASFYDAVTP